MLKKIITTVCLLYALTLPTHAGTTHKSNTIINLNNHKDVIGSRGNFNVVFTDPRVRAAKAGHNTAGFVEIANMTNQDLQIVKATCDAAYITEMHISIEENNIHKMRPVSFISIDKGETTILQPGGLHIMLVNLKKNLGPGKKVDIVLTFDNGHKVTVPFIVKEICNHCH